MPLGVAPAAMQRMAHPEGECANARGKYYILILIMIMSHYEFPYFSCFLNNLSILYGYVYLISKY